MEVCYRHPKRETGVRCSNCERPICPDCMTSTPVGMRCPECARQGTKVRTMRTLTGEPMLTYILIGINVLAGIGSLLGGRRGRPTAARSPTTAGVSQATIADGDYWRLITAGFLHAGPFHLLTNMLALWILGSLLEPALGKWRFGLVYFVSLLCGSFGALLLSPDSLTVGASGAVFGLMGAAAIVRAQPRPQPDGERPRHLDRPEPADHVHDPEHLDRRAHRRAGRRHRRRASCSWSCATACGSRTSCRALVVRRAIGVGGRRRLDQ